MKCTKREFTRFASAGLVNTAVSYGLYLMLLSFLPYAVSYALAYAAGMALSFGLNCRFVFRTPMALDRALRYPFAYAVQYALSALILWAVVALLAVDPRLAPLPAVGLTVPVVFLLTRRILKGGSGQPRQAGGPEETLQPRDSLTARIGTAASRLVFNGALALLSAVLAVCLAEGLLRFTGYASLIGRDVGAPQGYYMADRENGYDIRPGQGPSTFEFRDSSHPVWSNELGCFDAPFGGDERFILLLGDSTSWGYKELDKTWGAVVERETGVRVLKCAVPGFGTRHEVLKGRNVLAVVGRSPAVILVGHCANDHIDDYLHPFYTVVDGHMLAHRSLADFRTGAIREKSLETLQEEMRNWERYGVTETPRHPVLKRVKKFLSEHSIAYRLAQPHVETILLGAPSLAPLAEALIDPPAFRPEEYLRILYQPEGSPWLENAWRGHLENLQNLRRLADEHGARLLVVLIPTREQVYGLGGAGSGIRLEEANEKLQRFFAKEGIPALDALPAFRRYAAEAAKRSEGSLPPLYWRYDSHGSAGADHLLGILAARRLLEDGAIGVIDTRDRLARIHGALERFHEGEP